MCLLSVPSVVYPVLFAWQGCPRAFSVVCGVLSACLRLRLFVSVYVGKWREYPSICAAPCFPKDSGQCNHSSLLQGSNNKHTTTIRRTEEITAKVINKPPSISPIVFFFPSQMSVRNPGRLELNPFHLLSSTLFFFLILVCS